MIGKICVFGLGHAGLPTSLSFAELGWTVVGVDYDSEKVKFIESGKSPFHEPEVDVLLQKHLANGRFVATSEAAEAVASADVVVICVGTPQLPDGGADLSFLRSATATIARHMTGYTLVVQKSTVPPGTASSVVAPILEECVPQRVQYDLAVNPEFLREGSAVYDCLHPDRLVFGVDSQRAKEVFMELYGPLLDGDQRVPSEQVGIVVTNWATAELIKQASNAFLATKISFINMLADMCDASGANVLDLARGLGSDPRINHHYLNAGLGFGGQCLPKDLRGLAAYGKGVGVDVSILESVDVVNTSRVDRILDRVVSLLGGVEDRTIAVWGVAFKPGTDDVAEAPSLNLIPKLVDRGAVVRVYDPEALGSFQETSPLSDTGVYACETGLQAAEGADVLLILTDWYEFIHFDLSLLKAAMKSPVVIDGRNCMNALEMQRHGFMYSGFGLPPVGI